MFTQPISLIVGSYVLGALPFSLIVSRIKGIDLRKVGSGNLGATNVYRAMGFKYALVVFLLDAIKGYIPTHIALNLTDPSMHILVGFMAIVGHSLSPFVKFKGGKGAATGIGVLMAISPDVCSIVALIAIAMIAIFRYVSLATILCSLLTPLLLWGFGYPIEYVTFVGIISAFIIVRHRPNIQRLLTGQENKV